MKFRATINQRSFSGIMRQGCRMLENQAIKKFRTSNQVRYSLAKIPDSVCKCFYRQYLSDYLLIDHPRKTGDLQTQIMTSVPDPPLLQRLAIPDYQISFVKEVTHGNDY